MKIVAIMPVRNEDWCLRFTLEALLAIVDEAVVLDHASTDSTPKILKELSERTKRVTTLTSSDATWFEMAHRQLLLEAARSRKATHIVTIDADEVVSSHAAGLLRKEISLLRPKEIGQLQWGHLWRGIDQFRVDGPWRSKWASYAFADNPVFCWQARHGYDHHHRHPFGSETYKKTFQGTSTSLEFALLHLQHVVWRRLRAKQAWYQMVEVVRWPTRETAAQVRLRYSGTVSEVGCAVETLPSNILKPYAHLLQYLDLSENKPPWQELECQRMMKEYGPHKFKGLDLFGVV